MTERVFGHEVFDRAESFEDLVEANLKFLDGEIPRTPNHAAPLNKESQLIIEPMRAMCTELRVMTVDAQPAYVKLMRRQRGYVIAYIRISIDVQTIGEALSQCNLVCYVARVGEPSSKACVIVDESLENYHEVSQTRTPGTIIWTGSSFFVPGRNSPTQSGELEDFDTAKYSPSQDKSVVLIETADADWGFGADHCILQTHSAIRRLLDSS